MERESKPRSSTGSKGLKKTGSGHKKKSGKMSPPPPPNSAPDTPSRSSSGSGSPSRKKKSSASAATDANGGGAANGGGGDKRLLELAHNKAVAMLHGGGLTVRRETEKGLQVKAELRLVESSPGMLAMMWWDPNTHVEDAVPLARLTEIREVTDQTPAGPDLPQTPQVSSARPQVPGAGRLVLSWTELSLTLVPDSEEERSSLALCLNQLRSDLIASSGGADDGSDDEYYSLRLNLLKAHDTALDETTYFRCSEAFGHLDPLVMKWRVMKLRNFWYQWTMYVRDENRGKMEGDRNQWLLHANARQNDDLQAWYHSVFSDELYRLKGPFWYKEAALQEYKYHPIKASVPDDTPASVLCTPDMTYATMAATMYTIRAKLDEAEYALFESLTSDGVMLMKHPRNGRPQKKLFQLSLVQGEMYLFMYLTWKGKHGTQGVELASVEKITSGIGTEVLRRTGKLAKAQGYLSLVLPDRSLDLCFENEDERATFQACMSRLISMERTIRNESPLKEEMMMPVEEEAPPPPL